MFRINKMISLIDKLQNKDKKVLFHVTIALSKVDYSKFLSIIDKYFWSGDFYFRTINGKNSLDLEMLSEFDDNYMDINDINYNSDKFENVNIPVFYISSSFNLSTYHPDTNEYIKNQVEHRLQIITTMVEDFEVIKREVPKAITDLTYCVVSLYLDKETGKSFFNLKDVEALIKLNFIEGN